MRSIKCLSGRSDPLALHGAPRRSPLYMRVHRWFVNMTKIDTPIADALQRGQTPGNGGDDHMLEESPFNAAMQVRQSLGNRPARQIAPTDVLRDPTFADVAREAIRD